MRITWLLLLVILSFALVMSCSEDKATSPSADGTLKILLTDSPGEFEEVNITFSEISVHAGDDTSDAEGEWIIVNSETQTFNLLTLSNGVTSLLGEKKLEPRHYTQIRLEITDAELIVDSETFSLDVPSSKLKFTKGFDMTAGIETQLIVDFDAARSIHQTGSSQYILQPTIRVIAEDLSGAIKGTVTDPENVPVAYAIADGDTITSTFVKEDSTFLLAYLPEGTYTVSVTDTLEQTSSIDNIAVTIGNVTDAGSFSLSSVDKGTLNVLLTDSPGEFEEVNITFSEISVHAGDGLEDEWIIISDVTQTFDLLTLNNGQTSALGQLDLEPGHYTQVRLEITDAEVVVNSEVFSLDVPSSKLKFVKGFDLTEGIETKLIVDFDAARSIHQTGNDQYKLQPTIRVIAEDQSGAITGAVTNPENVPVAYAIAESDTVTSSFVDIDTGSFKLAFLPENTYTVAVTDTLDQTSVNEGIVVTVGNITPLGDITLE